MSDSKKSPFSEQLTKWWDLVSAKDTWDSFKKFFELAWTIIKETGLLIWLFLLGGLVSIGWVVDRSSELTDSVKSLQSQASQAEDGNVVAEAGKSLWTATKTSVDNALQTARTQLDIKAPEKKPKASIAAKTESKSSKAPAAAASSAPAADTPKASSPPPAEDKAAVKDKAKEEITRTPDSQEPPEAKES